MIYVGLDPGKTGGVAMIFEGAQMTIAETRPMPDMQQLAMIMMSMADDSLHVFIEKAQAMPKNGVAGMFAYGDHFGQLQGILIGLRIPYTLVPPREWSRVMHAGTKGADTKLRSAEAAMRLFPKTPLRPEGSKMVKPHSGMTEALLIAEYGRRSLVGEKAKSA